MYLLYGMLNKELKLLGSVQAQFFTLLSICKYNIQCPLDLMMYHGNIFNHKCSNTNFRDGIPNNQLSENQFVTILFQFIVLGLMD